MAKAILFVPLLRQLEGGWSNHKADRGGATMRGVTYRTFCYWRQLKKQPQPSLDDLLNITDEEWMQIFTTMYWNKWKADLIVNQSIANLLVDFAWGSGVSTSIRYIQRHVLQVTADGIVGPVTLGAINGHPRPSELFNQIKAARLQFIDSLVERCPEQNVFKKGWYNRINRIVFKEEEK